MVWFLHHSVNIIKLGYRVVFVHSAISVKSVSLVVKFLPSWQRRSLELFPLAEFTRKVLRLKQILRVLTTMRYSIKFAAWDGLFLTKAEIEQMGWNRIEMLEQVIFGLKIVELLEGCRSLVCHWCCGFSKFCLLVRFSSLIFLSFLHFSQFSIQSVQSVQLVQSVQSIQSVQSF